MRKTFSEIMLSLLIIGMLTLAFNIQPVKASGTIYIRADGSIDPPTAPIQRNGNVYTLTGNVTSDADGIVIERNDMALDGAGYTIRGYFAGIRLDERTNVTIKNIEIVGFWHGIYGEAFEDCTIVGNNMMGFNDEGIHLEWSSYNNIMRNNISHSETGIFVGGSSKYNNIAGNNIRNNGIGIYLSIYYEDHPSDNLIYHNNFITNSKQVLFDIGYANFWDDDYPSGGNYWSDYSTRYPDAQELDDSGIWDTPYVINAHNKDNYPLMEPWSPTLPVKATIDMSPNSLNLKSKGRWITCYIEFREDYNVSDINTSTIKLNSTIPAELRSTSIQDQDSDTIPDLMVKFNRAQVISYILRNTRMKKRSMTITLTITGKLEDNTTFQDSKTIRIIG